MYHDILTDKQVFFDITAAEFESHLQKLRDNGFTAISLDQLVVHLKTGLPLPAKPVLLTFDDGYVGHYEHVYPLLKKYNMPGVFSIFPGKVDGQVGGRSTVTWDQLKTLAADPLVTIASHSVTHPADLRAVDDATLQRELMDSKARLETQLGIPIHYFTYPVGHYDDRVMAAVQQAGYLAALTMRNADEQLASASKNVLAIERIGQSRLATILDSAWGGPTQPTAFRGTDFTAPVAKTRVRLNDIDLVLVSGGQATTIHADTRYAVAAIKGRDPKLVAAVDGGFFSLKSLDSNVMIGPVLSQATGQFIPGGNGDNPKLAGRPLVLISPQKVMFVPFDPAKHNTLAGIQQVLPEVTDAFVSSAWLVKEGVGQPYASFGNLFGFDAYRHRAFWGVDHAGRPVIGISAQRVDSPALGQALALAGFRTAVMLDSGASADLAYRGKSVVSSYEPRPVPHIVGLWPPPAPETETQPTP
ncbi:MAG: polysaccharide deacetylase family protein [Gloeomargaritaceae cyanobacterium C42_A2020_066]|nr:polysaccharide deacetylase family protein [Gloeomargaritaceae cyanobacterium C42_A2020_066]